MIGLEIFFKKWNFYFYILGVVFGYNSNNTLFFIPWVCIATSEMSFHVSNTRIITTWINILILKGE